MVVAAKPGIFHSLKEGLEVSRFIDHFFLRAVSAISRQRLEKPVLIGFSAAFMFKIAHGCHKPFHDGYVIILAEFQIEYFRREITRISLFRGPLDIGWPVVAN